MAIFNLLVSKVKDNIGDYCENGEVKGFERVLSIGSGAALALYGIKRIKKSPVTAISQLSLAGALLWRGISGKCKVKEMVAEQMDAIE